MDRREAEEVARSRGGVVDVEGIVTELRPGRPMAPNGLVVVRADGEGLRGAGLDE